MPAYEHRHVVGFDETSLVGNVYFSRYLEWQGICREHFLAEHARDVVEDLMRKKLAFFTRACSCEYLGDWGFTALDEVLLRMWLRRFRGGRMTLEFEYARVARPDETIARGMHEVACKRSVNGSWVPAPFPPSIVRALLEYADSEELRGNLREALEFQASSDPDSL
jgi:enediyne biosynthesis thioesterase